ncbi:hypothetical protein IWQ60_008947 [Tieghemiomyces parasiticus]|uniref:1-alkyl-2-acetylglycerophosphocholine esterase n=1 Tax=Tieghemiomyces parasiticus TaxID=78921 RepID=A0A9W7ZZI1_9FUNG|nr:hypothetical protein IWQ60_008947 [Tieghemiomyces parasiticus]
MDPETYINAWVEAMVGRARDPATKPSRSSRLPSFRCFPSVPKYTGPFPVGVHDIEWKKTDVASEVSALQPELFDTAYVTARIYYPAAPTGREARPHWMPQPISVYTEGYGRYLKLPKWTSRIATGFIRTAKLDARIRPPLAASLSQFSTATEKTAEADAATEQAATRFPVIYFVHGIATCRSTCALVCGELASRGFVVVTPECSDGSGATCYSPHMKVHYKPIPEDHDRHAYWHQRLLWRTIELEETIRMVERVVVGTDQDPGMPDGLSEYSNPHRVFTEEELERDGGFRLRHLRGRLDLDQTILAGHSFGSAVVFQDLSSFSHPNVKAVVALDPWIYAMSRNERILDHPVLIINSEFFTQWDEHHSEMLQPYICSKQPGRGKDKANSLLITILGARHNLEEDPFILSDDDTTRPPEIRIDKRF